jgi:hypothetical protein
MMEEFPWSIGGDHVSSMELSFVDATTFSGRPGVVLWAKAAESMVKMKAHAKNITRG